MSEQVVAVGMRFATAAPAQHRPRPKVGRGDPSQDLARPWSGSLSRIACLFT